MKLLFITPGQQAKQGKRSDVYIFNASHVYYWILLGVWIWSAVGCTFPGGDRPPPQIKLIIQNTLPIKRTDVPIIVTLEELREVAPDFSFDAYLVVSGAPPTEIHSQADDTNYDGQKDELVFLVDLEPQETKEASIRYAPGNQMAVTLEFTKRTRTGIFPEMKGLAALESELIAYLLNSNGAIQAYGKKAELLFSLESRFQSDLNYRSPISAELWQAFENNGVSLSRNTTIEIQKPDSSWLITDPHDKQKYVVTKGDTHLNIYRAKRLSINRLVHQIATQSHEDENVMTPLTPAYGLIGCGGFALWDKTDQKLIQPPDTNDYVRVLADGPVRSVVQRIIPNWQLQTGTIHLVSTIVIYAGHEWAEHRIKIQGLESRYCIATGIPNHGIKPVKNATEGWLWTWGEQGTITSPTKLGIGAIYPADQWDSFQNSVTTGSQTASFIVLINPGEEGKVIYRFFCVWGEGEIGIQTQEEFDQYVEIMAADIQTPPRIKFLPQPQAK